MQIIRTHFILPHLAFVLSLAFVMSGCDMATAGREPGECFENVFFRDVVGITEEQIDAIERIRGQRDGFVYAMTHSAEAFIRHDGTPGGFSAYFAYWLSDMFGIPFNVKIVPWDELLAGLDSGDIDFTGELLFTDERRGDSFMAGPITERRITIMRVAGREFLPALLPMRYVFLRGSVVYGLVAPYLHPGSLKVFVDDVDTAYQMVVDGEVDAFIDKGIAMSAMEFGNMEVSYFLPMIYIPISISTRNPELEPFISVLQKALNASAMYQLSLMYRLGYRDYLRWQLNARLSPAEREFMETHGTRDNPIKIVAKSCNYPVSFFDEKTGKWQGIVFDILHEISQHTGLYFAVANAPRTPWIELKQMVDTGQALMFSELMRTQDRAGRFIWADAPFQRDSFALISHGNVDPIRIGQVVHSSVGMVVGSPSAEMFNQWFPGHAGTVLYAKDCDAFQGLFRGEVDFVMGPTQKLLALTHCLERPGFKVNFVFESHPSASYFAFSADQAVLRSIVSQAQAFVDTGFIVTRWERQAFDHRARLAEARLPWLIGALVLLSCVIALSLVLMYRVRREGKRLERLVSEQTRELQIASEEAMTASYIKSEFLANMSHEIRTPLNAVIGMTAIARSSDDLERIGDCLSKIEGASQQLMKVINEILDISKIEAGKFEMASEPFVFDDMVTNIRNIIEVRSAEKKLHFVIDSDENIPGALVGDEMRLSQILINLLSNAVKFTPEGGTVRFSTRHVSRRNDMEIIEFVVRDSGIGIAEEQQKKMFDAFSQADSGVANRFGGTGLGLPISKNFVELMGGDIFVESSLGMGTCFTVQIPFIVGDPGMVKHSRVTEDGAELDLRGRTLLLVEDVEINREIVISLLDDTGVIVDCAENGQVAVDMFMDSPDRYDLIFMDIQMPVLNGYIATRVIRALDLPRARTVPIVAMTANAFADDVEKCREVGMNDHIAKPVDVEVLMNIVGKYLAGKERRA
ncbi:MAG: ATP-binding protein [Treponema sp.]|nr:ATP-binding protein [Treponema sp.]